MNEEEPSPSISDIVQMRAWKHALLTTYTLSLSYFESEILRALLRGGCSDIWLIADAEGYRSSLLERRSMRVGQEYRLIPVALPDGVFHAKCIYLADGATTNAVIAKLRMEAKKNGDELLQSSLRSARFNMDVVVGLTDMARVAKLVQGRNRSIQVKEWSLNDFRGGFGWLKELIDRPDGPFRNKIGWEENALAVWSVLDLISLMTLFHPAYGGRANRRRRAPTVAFSSKGTADRRLLDTEMSDGYRTLEPVLEDVVRLHDHVYAQFERAYGRYNRDVHGKGAKLGRRRGIEARAIILPLTGTKSEYRVEKGLIFPLLAAFRSLLQYSEGKASWRKDPIEFFDKFGPDLVGRLFDEYEKLGKNPAAVGKNASVYETLYEKAENLSVTSELLRSQAE